MRRHHVVLSTLALIGATAAAVTPLAAADDPINRLAAFGQSLVAAGDAVLVGELAPAKGGGVVHVYRRSPAGLWRESGTVVAPDDKAGNGFGATLAADARTLLVTWHSSSADSARGGVLAFRKTATGSWVSAGRLGPETPAAQARFGMATAVSGDWAFVSAPGEKPMPAVHVFHRAADGSWQESGTLPFAAGSEPGATDAFGQTLAVDGDRLAVGALLKDARGAVYLYHRDGDRWVADGAPITGRTLSANARFGGSMLFHQDQLYVGAPGMNTSAGAVVVFDHDASKGSWTESGMLAPFDGGPNLFGQAQAMVGDELWVSAPANGRNVGAIFRFHRAKDGSWSSATRMTDDSSSGAGQFGRTLAQAPGVVAVGMPSDAGGEGTVLFYTKSATGTWMAKHRMFIKDPEFAAVTGGEVRCNGGMVREFQCNNTGLMSFLPISAIGGKRGTHLNDNWGWTDPKDGREYALLGRTDGTSFVDITDPIHPRYLGDLPLTKGANPAAWRDIKVYKDHAFIVSDGAGPHGMQVFDLTRLRGVKVPQTFTADYIYREINSAHNIVINEQSGFAYAVGASSGGTTCGGGLHMIDIHDPMHPTFAGCFQDTQTGRSKTGYSHDAQCVMYHGPDARYSGHEICIGSNETDISVADVTDKKNPKAVSHASYPDVGYTHQAWLSDDQKYLYVDDELDELNGKGEAAKGTRTLVWDMAKLDDPVLVKQYVGNSKSIDHNLYVKGNRIYEANYTSGLRILDISDPVNPREVGFFDTYPDGDPVQFDGAWSNYPYFKSGTIIVTSIGQGVFFVKDRTTIVP